MFGARFKAAAADSSLACFGAWQGEGQGMNWLTRGDPSSELHISSLMLWVQSKALTVVLHDTGTNERKLEASHCQFWSAR